MGETQVPEKQHIPPHASGIFWRIPGGTCVETETGHAFCMDGGAILSARRHEAFGYTKHTVWQLLIPLEIRNSPPNGKPLAPFWGGVPYRNVVPPMHLQYIRRGLQINWFLQILYSKHPQKPMNGYQKKDRSGRGISGFTTWPEILGILILRKFQGCNPSLNFQLQTYNIV